jgi:hypothetical protein
MVDDEISFFEELFSNWIFWFLLILIVSIQIILIEEGGNFFGNVD